MLIKLRAWRALLLKKQLQKEPVRIPIRKLADAIAVFEGWTKEGSVAKKNNNPCNLRWSKYQKGQKRGFAYFKKPKIGWQACIYDLSCKAQGNTITKLTPESTIEDLIYAWAPLSDNNPTDAYVAYVSKTLKVGKDYKLKNFLI